MSTRATTPYWERTSVPEFRPLTTNLDVDVVVVGAGIAGTTAAYLLKRDGHRVALLDRAAPASIDTGHTTAHLTAVTDTRLTTLIDTFGEDHARAIWDAGFAAISTIDEIVRREQIDCHFAWVPGYLHLPVEDAGADPTELQKEAAAAQQLGFDAEYRERVPFMHRPGIEFPGQARFHPRKYLAQLLSLIDGDGSAVFTTTNVTEVTDDPLTVVCGDRRLRARYVVVATHNPVMGAAGLVRATVLQTKLHLYTSYVVAARVEPNRVPDALFWDNADPYKYLRIDRGDGGDVVILGGEDHKTGQVSDTDACYTRLGEALERLVPGARVEHRWSGQVIETVDGLPFIGEITDGQFIATGFSGNGMTFGTLSAMMAADAVAGRGNPWRTLFDPNRIAIQKGIVDYLTENADYPYYLVRDRFAGTQGKDLRRVARGSGMVLDLDGRQAAAYRDDAGHVTVRSAICTHMGCTVRWNTAERTWDCPCHGSRFTPAGDVISGPAESPLPPLGDDRSDR